MALNFLEGFDAMASADLAARYTSMHASNTVVASGRNSGNCVRTGNWQWTHNLTFAPHATRIVGFAFKCASLPNGTRGVVSLMDGSILHVTMALGTDGILRVYRGASSGTLLATGTTALVGGAFYYLELEATISDAAGVVRVQVNGAPETLSFVTGTETTQDTQNAGNATSNAVRFMDASNSSTPGNPMDIDDIYILDGDEADPDNPNNSFLGDIRVEALLPSGAGDTTDFTPSAGSNYQNVDDSTPDGDTTYNESSTTNDVDTFAMSDLATATGSVVGIELCNYARKTDAGAALLAGVIRPVSTDRVGTDRAPSTSYRYLSNIWDVNPDTGVAFTVGEVNATKAGYKKSG